MEQDMDKALESLKGQKRLTLILGDWDEGLELSEALTQEEVRAQVITAREKYGTYFSWRVFNREVDLYWNGESGVLCEGAPRDDHIKWIFLETDYRRFPGAGIFESRYTQAKVEEIHQRDRVVYLRLLKLCKEDESYGSST